MQLFILVLFQFFIKRTFTCTQRSFFGYWTQINLQGPISPPSSNTLDGVGHVNTQILGGKKTDWEG